MLRCAICGREYDVPGPCPSCEGAAAPSPAEQLLELEPGAGGEARPAGGQPIPLLEALATELNCPSCRTAVPPVSHFCGVCGLRLAPGGRSGAAPPKTQRGPP